MDWQIPIIFNKTNLLFVFAIFVIWVAAVPSIQFETVDIVEEKFPGAVSEWTIKGGSDNTVIGNNSVSIKPTNSERGRVYKTYPVVTEGRRTHYLNVKASYRGIAQSNEVSAKDQIGKPTVVYLWFEDANKKRVSIKILAKVVETDNWNKINAVIAIPNSAINVNVGLLFRDFTKGVELGQLNIVRLQHADLYLWAIIFFALVLVYLFSRLVSWIWSTARAFHATVVLIVAIVVLLAFILPGRTWVIPINQLLEALIGDNPNRVAYSVAKYQNYAHFIGFLLFTPIVLSFANASRYGIADVLYKLVLFAVFTEVLQRHTTVRTSNVEDVVINLSGILLGTIVWFWFSVVRKRDMSNELA